jgi:hypothetical protein
MLRETLSEYAVKPLYVSLDGMLRGTARRRGKPSTAVEEHVSHRAPLATLITLSIKLHAFTQSWVGTIKLWHGWSGQSAEGSAAGRYLRLILA